MKCAPPILFLLLCLGQCATAADATSEGNDFFQSKIEPILRQRCYECHSHEKAIKGGLALDSKSGWEVGGDGGTAVVPNDPEKSRLIVAVKYSNDELRMPPKMKLSDDEIALLEQWVKQGAPDPRVTTPANSSKAHWESIYQQRLTWWSLQPVARSNPPIVRDKTWSKNEVDQFILAALEKKSLKPVAEADRRTLARRLSFALTGLPPDPKSVDWYFANSAANADDEFVQSLIDSPAFGEHWARHWMDVVHYTDTHGYEWDIPAKNAWRYRDYLVRAFNNDVPYNQLIVEQIAGDLITPRIDTSTGLNESLIGPMALRLGERRHGDNSAIEGISQEAVANVIDTVSKGFLATTVGCSQCHDHKLDAVEQRDYYGLAGVLLSTRWGVRTVDTSDPNLEVIEELKQIKREIRGEVAKLWGESKASLAAKFLAIPATEPEKSDDTKRKRVPPAGGFPESVSGIWRRITNGVTDQEALPATWSKFATEFASEREKRTMENKANLKLMADFTSGQVPAGWQIDGFGLKHGLAGDGELVIANDGETAIAQVLPAGRYSHVWSSRLAGAIRSPLFGQDPPPTFSLEFAAGKCGSIGFVVEQSFHGESMTFFKTDSAGWKTLTAGNFPAISPGPTNANRRVYLELVTKSLNNNFPPRWKFAGVADAEINDERSWIGASRIYEHPAGKAPQDELKRFAAAFSNVDAPKTKEEFAARLADLFDAAIQRWAAGSCDSEDVRLIDEALNEKWLTNETASTPKLAELIAQYRAAEKRLQPDQTVGSAADWNEGRDERIGIRGSYTDLGATVPRGNVRFLGGAASRTQPDASGRLELALSIASEQNPLTARVIVNRVWHYLFGAGLVRTPDDFGHLGEHPSHPELLDYLAIRFMEEGWSVKKLVKLLVTSATWRQSSVVNPASHSVDPENRLWHHVPMRRLEAEAVRDSLLAVAGRLDRSLFGPPIDPPRSAQDPAKRLVNGPLDGNGRRSLYLKMTLMEPPRFLAIFNQPLPKLTVGKRDATNVPDQALTLLNDPFVVAMANHWSKRVVEDSATSSKERATQMFATAFSRPPNEAEIERLMRFVDRTATARGLESTALMRCEPLWQDVAHAIFNLKEFVYVQ